MNCSRDIFGAASLLGASLFCKRGENMKRDFIVKGINFTVADYRPRNNDFERGLKYQLLIRVYDGPRDSDFYYRSTGAKFATISAARDYASKNIVMWL